MPYKVITLPFNPDKEVFQEDILNQFCLNKKVISCKSEFFRTSDKAYWTVFIEYDIPLGDTDAIDDLNEADKLLFQRLRQWRKLKAEEQGVPVFIIATNSILKSLALNKPVTVEGLKEIRGLGKGKIDRYGKELLEITRGFAPKQ